MAIMVARCAVPCNGKISGSPLPAVPFGQGKALGEGTALDLKPPGAQTLVILKGAYSPFPLMESFNDASKVD